MTRLTQHDLKEGLKIRCISREFSHSGNLPLIEIGKVYTIDSVNDYNKFTLLEVNVAHDRRPYYVPEDFELYDLDTDVLDAWDRAMGIL